MNDNLVQRLRDLAEEWFEMCEDIHEPLYEAAERIEAQAAEIAILRQPQTDALKAARDALERIRDVEDIDPVWTAMSALAAIDAIDAALEQSK